MQSRKFFEQRLDRLTIAASEAGERVRHLVQQGARDGCKVAYLRVLGGGKVLFQGRSHRKVEILVLVWTKDDTSESVPA